MPVQQRVVSPESNGTTHPKILLFITLSSLAPSLGQLKENNESESQGEHNWWTRWDLLFHKIRRVVCQHLATLITALL